MSAKAYEGKSVLAAPVTVQTTPTMDPTMTALQKEQLTLQINQLQNQKSWLENNSTALIAAVVTVVVALFGISQWAINRRDERRKEIAAQDKDLRAQAEERFQTAVTALGAEKESVQVDGAILLRSFLNINDEKIYGRYYTQVFDLAVAYLRLSSTSQTSEDASAPLPLSPLRQALIVVFREAFPLARDERKRALSPSPFYPRILDASRIKLDNTNLAHADLNDAWLLEANFRKTNLGAAYLSNADLRRVDFTEAHLGHAQLNGANLRHARLDKANLIKANLVGADLNDANLSGAYLYEADLGGVLHLEDVLSLDHTNLRGVKGLTKEQIEACKSKGAIIDEDTPASAPCQMHLLLSKATMRKSHRCQLLQKVHHQQILMLVVLLPLSQA